MKKPTELFGSIFIKYLQLCALLIAAILLLFYCCRCEAHVDLHFHSLEWEAHDERVSEENRGRKEIERSIKENDPNISREDLRREVREEVKRKRSA